MVKSRKDAETSNGGRTPAWIYDTENQRKWNNHFRTILKRDYENSDPVILAILNDVELCDLCGTKVRSYVDKDISAWLNRQRKNRGAKFKKRLETAIAGLHAAKEICEEQGDQSLAVNLGTLAMEFSRALGRCKIAFATKRHGRDRNHAILYECHSFLQGKLGRPVTYVTLANLVNAAFEADGKSPEDPIDEEQIRKNLTNFKRNNPLALFFGST